MTELKLSEDERQVVVMALAHLGKLRHGWRDYLRGIAYRICDAEQLDAFQEHAEFDLQIWGEAAIEAAFGAMVDQGTLADLNGTASAPQLVAAYRTGFTYWMSHGRWGK